MRPDLFMRMRTDLRRALRHLRGFLLGDATFARRRPAWGSCTVQAGLGLGTDAPCVVEAPATLVLTSEATPCVLLPDAPPAASAKAKARRGKKGGAA